MTFGTMRDLDDGRWELQFVRTLPHAPEKVWQALTEPEHLQAWFPTAIEGERVAGARLRFVFREGEGPTEEGTLVTYDPPRLLEFSWGEETLRFELAAQDSGTVLTFLNTFTELGKAARDAAGWHTCLDLLGQHLTGEQPAWKPEERWAEVHPSYVQQLGPEASTIGPPASG
jgi:uncharacterized protein YndB with AHSA1/START domain